ncbi:MAG: peptidylprolyl isomerase [Brevundimonas sp.]|nr:MAG: peptidylprolyl isomerase [Brevundimonas sp.]
MKSVRAAAIAALSLFVRAVPAPEARAQDAGWRTVAPQNLMIVQTSKGRVLLELDPRIAPNHVQRLQTLTQSGFYDGLRFHRVIPGFMAQTGDPQGPGMGGSQLPDLQREFSFRRPPGGDFSPVADGQPGLRGLYGSVPVVSQPDGQAIMMADGRVTAQPIFCRGVIGMARSNSPDSANSQFFLMTGYNSSLNGTYTALGRVVDGMDVVDALNAGTRANNGQVAQPDVMMTVRLASDLPPAQRPTVRIMTAGSTGISGAIEALRVERGAQFSVCDVEPRVRVTG